MLKLVLGLEPSHSQDPVLLRGSLVVVLLLKVLLGYLLVLRLLHLLVVGDEGLEVLQPSLKELVDCCLVLDDEALLHEPVLGVLD